MKKRIFVFLTVLCLFSGCFFSVCAEEKKEVISIAFKSDLAGATFRDAQRFSAILSGNIRYTDPEAFVADYAGDVYLDGLKPGRTYTVLHSFTVNDGYAFPEVLDESTVRFTCDPGCTVYWYGITEGACVDGARTRYIEFHTTVTVDGNFFQRLFGKIADFFLKVRAWSPY